MDELNTKVDKLKSKISESHKILVIASTPVDYDSLGTALTVKWYIATKYRKECTIYIFANILDSARAFPGFEGNIQQKHPDKVDFSSFDLIILVDGNALRQFFTAKYEEYTPSIKAENLYSIDHHESGPIGEYIPENTIRKKDSCTSKIFFDYFIKPDNLTINQEVATWLYMSLIGDTGIFKFEIYDNTFEYAQMLISNGVDHYKAVDFKVSKDVMDFTVWAIENTQYFENAQSTILALDNKTKEILIEKFGKNWENNSLSKYYENIFLHTVEGYPYGIIFKEGKDDGKTRVSWRCSALSEVEVMLVLREIGFTANGHRNAGGGISDKSIPQAIEEFTKAMESKIGQNSKNLYTNL
jgi:bifunctional oligoribonuclease and PAP phosphatase NrnA